MIFLNIICIFLKKGNMLAGYFKIIGLPQTHDLGLIKTAYKKMASKYHPDKNLQNKHWAEEKFKLVSEAYRLIMKHLNSQTTSDFEGSEAFYRPDRQRAMKAKFLITGIPFAIAITQKTKSNSFYMN